MQNDIDHTPTKNIGGLSGKTPEEIAINFPAKIVSLYNQHGENFCSKALYRDCLEEINQRRQKNDYFSEND